MLAGLKRYYGNDDLHFITFSCYRAGGSDFSQGGLPFAPLSHANGGSLFWSFVTGSVSFSPSSCSQLNL